MNDEKKEYLSIKACAEIIGVSRMTIYRWYKWYESESNTTDLKLPEIHRFGSYGEKFIKRDELDMLVDFKNKIRNGMMADYNVRHSWGKRGNELIENRKQNEEELKKIINKSKNSI